MHEAQTLSSTLITETTMALSRVIDGARGATEFHPIIPPKIQKELSRLAKAHQNADSLLVAKLSQQIVQLASSHAQKLMLDAAKQANPAFAQSEDFAQIERNDQLPNPNAPESLEICLEKARSYESQFESARQSNDRADAFSLTHAWLFASLASPDSPIDRITYAREITARLHELTRQAAQHHLIV